MTTLNTIIQLHTEDGYALSELLDNMYHQVPAASNNVMKALFKAILLELVSINIAETTMHTTYVIIAAEPYKTNDGASSLSFAAKNTVYSLR